MISLITTSAEVVAIRTSKNAAMRKGVGRNLAWRSCSPVGWVVQLYDIEINESFRETFRQNSAKNGRHFPKKCEAGYKTFYYGCRAALIVRVNQEARDARFALQDCDQH